MITNDTNIDEVDLAALKAKGPSPFDHLYCFSKGEYSDYKETWYTHERLMTKPEVFELLREKWPAVRQAISAARAELDGECLRVFGVCDPKDFHLGLVEWRDITGTRVCVCIAPRGTLEQAREFLGRRSMCMHGELERLLAACGFRSVEIPFVIPTDDYGSGIGAVDKMLERGAT